MQRRSLRSFTLLTVLCGAVAGLQTPLPAAESDIVIYAADVTTLAGWSRQTTSGAAGGVSLTTPDAGWSSPDAPLASPSSYFEASFSAPAATNYHVWLRLRAANNSKYNDSVWVQFSDARASGTPAYGIGSTSGLLVNLENCSGCGTSGWGWKDGAYWLSQASTIQFASTGTHTIRVQVREDGVEIDQMVLSPSTFLSSAPGSVTGDTTIVPKSTPSTTMSTPFTGTPAAVPGRVDAANFDNGGAGIAYSDTTSGNSGGAYRSTDVDLETSSLGGYDVGWVAPGEWLNYTVNVSTAGAYSAAFSVACPGAGGTFHLEVDGSNVTGGLTIPNTGGWQSWQTVTANATLPAGRHIMRLVVDSANAGLVGNFSAFTFALSTSSTPTSTPYSGTPAAIPGTIEAVDFDNGGAGVAYSDTTSGNSGGAYRSTDVDIEASSAGGYDVGWTAPGEWLNYTVNVTATDYYTATFRVAASGQGGTFHLEMNGAAVTGPLTIPNTGGWQSWQTVSAPVSLSAGRQIARLVVDGASNGVVGNFGRIQFAITPTPTPTSPTPYSGTPAPIPGTIDAAQFDNGGSGVAYSDTTSGNSGGAFRNTDVDIESSSAGYYDIGWAAAGEWLKYTVSVTSAGSYTAQIKVASPSGGSLHLQFGGPSNILAAVPVPSTGGWQTWSTVTVPVTLAGGVQQMTVQFDTGGVNLGPITIGTAPIPTGTPSSASVWLTTSDGAHRLEQQSPVQFTAGSGNTALSTITVDDTVRYQQIEGFGGSISDSGAWMLSHVSQSQQSAILTSLFDRNNGIGISFLRQPIGASDFALNAYTFDDISPSGTDYSLASFSIAHDRPYILPALRAARAINPGLNIIGSPWTAPAWMKTSHTLTDGGSLRPDAFAAYASYLVKFIQGYEAEGVPIDSLTVQNEPLTAPPYPSMYMTAGDQATFIGQNLGPALANAGLRPRVFTWDHNWDPTYPTAVLSDATAARYVSGAAFHCYGGQPDAMSTFHQSFPNIDIGLTECADSSRATFGDKLTYDVRVPLLGSLRNWAKFVFKWNLILDENGGPKLYSGTCRNCLGMVTINSSTGAVTYNEDYYAIGHASRFIQPGAYRVDSTAFDFGGIENAAFLNPDGSLVVLAINSSYGPLTFQIRSHGATMQYTLQSESVATFQWTPQ